MASEPPVDTAPLSEDPAAAAAAAAPPSPPDAATPDALSKLTEPILSQDDDVADERAASELDDGDDGDDGDGGGDGEGVSGGDGDGVGDGDGGGGRAFHSSPSQLNSCICEIRELLTQRWFQAKSGTNDFELSGRGRVQDPAPRWR